MEYWQPCIARPHPSASQVALAVLIIWWYATWQPVQENIQSIWSWSMAPSLLNVPAIPLKIRKPGLQYESAILWDIFHTRPWCLSYSARMLTSMLCSMRESRSKCLQLPCSVLSCGKAYCSSSSHHKGWAGIFPSRVERYQAPHHWITPPLVYLGLAGLLTALALLLLTTSIWLLVSPLLSALPPPGYEVPRARLQIGKTSALFSKCFAQKLEVWSRAFLWSCAVLGATLDCKVQKRWASHSHQCWPNGMTIMIPLHVPTVGPSLCRGLTKSS